MSKKKLAETLRKLEEKYGLDPPIEVAPELTMYENPYLTRDALDHIRRMGDPRQANELEWALKEYGVAEVSQSPEEYWAEQEEADA